jgi:hypothetical protein
MYVNIKKSHYNDSERYMEAKLHIRIPKHCYIASIYTSIIDYFVWLKYWATEISILLSHATLVRL